MLPAGKLRPSGAIAVRQTTAPRRLSTEVQRLRTSSCTSAVRPRSSVTARSMVRCPAPTGRREAAKMTAEATKPTAPTTMRMTPTVDSRKPWPEVVVIAQYMTAPAAIEMALRTIPVRPIVVTSIRKALANCQVSKEAGSERLQPSRGTIPPKGANQSADRAPYAAPRR